MANIAHPTQTLSRPLVNFGSRARTWLAAPKGDFTLILALILVGLVAQGLNMFNYPAFTLLDDEGIYAEQARSVLQGHSLTPYTYNYDHAPVGWMLISGWQLLSGGLHTFGTAIDSGRMLMLLLHLGMIPLLFGIVRKLGGNSLTAAIANLVFSLSPLAIFYQRMVLLDNLMLFFVLLSLDLLLDGWGRLSRLVMSGLMFGIALLCKETAIFILPAMIVIAMQQRWKHQGRFAVGAWVLPLMLTVSFYPLYALLKGELFPNGLSFDVRGNALLGGTEGVSLLDALLWQGTRSGGGLFNLDNQFWNLVRTDWLPRDTFLMIGGSLAVLVNLLRGIRNRQALMVGLLGLFPLVYLARGGVVFNYYILFAIPFLCLNLAIAFTPLVNLVGRRRKVAGWLALLLVPVLLAAYWLAGPLRPLYAEHPADSGRQAISWIKQNLPADSRIISRDDLWTDLREPGLGGPAFPNVHSHWKVATDKAVYDEVFQNDWHNVDYIIMSPNLDQDFATASNKLSLQAFQHSHLVKRWSADLGTESLHKHQIVELWKVDKIGTLDKDVLQGSSQYLSNNFGQTGAWAGSDGLVSSGAQANAMLRAVWTDNRAEFNRTWRWTQAHLINQNGLMAWEWQNGAILESHSDSGADTDLALALLMAAKRWNDPGLQSAGQKLVGSIWQNEVSVVFNKPYLTAGDWATRSQTLAFNPGYFAPYAYRIFMEIDPAHDWQGVIANGYQVLFDSASAPLSGGKAAGLPPDWIGLDRTSGKLVPLKLDQTDTTRYGFEAPRAYWRVALDLSWSNDQRAATFLKQAGFLRDEVNRLLQDGITRKGRVSSIYAHDGSVIQEPTSLVGTAGATGALLTLDPPSANLIYASEIIGGQSRNSQGIYWGQPQDLQTQTWGWFTTALYTGSLVDLWHNPVANSKGVNK